MRKFIFFLTLLGTAFGLSAAEAPDAVRVTPVTGEPVVFLSLSHYTISQRHSRICRDL